MNSNNTGRDLDDFRRFLTLSLFRLGLYKTYEDNKPIYCVGLLVRCEDPGGWVAVWQRCYDKSREGSRTPGEALNPWLEAGSETS